MNFHCYFQIEKNKNKNKRNLKLMIIYRTEQRQQIKQKLKKNMVQPFILFNA